MIRARKKAIKTPIVPTARDVFIAWSVLEKMSLPLESVSGLQKKRNIGDISMNIGDIFIHASWFVPWYFPGFNSPLESGLWECYSCFNDIYYFICVLKYFFLFMFIFYTRIQVFKKSSDLIYMFCIWIWVLTINHMNSQTWYATCCWLVPLAFQYTNAKMQLVTSMTAHLPR